MRLSRALVVAALLTLGVTACGGGGGTSDGAAERFDREEFGITFEIPSGFEEGSSVDVSKTGGADSVADAGIALDDDNGILISRYNLTAEVTPQNVPQVKESLDRLVSGLAGSDVSGTRVKYGGLPGYEYVVPLTDPPSGRSRLVFLFDRTAEYEINCQSTPDKRDELERGCQRALDTIERR